MLNLTSADNLLTLLSGKPVQPISRNEDIAAYQDALFVAATAAAPTAAAEAFALRLLPRFVRTPLKAWIAARKYERSLVRVWNVSPHLLNDMGIVLTANGTVPGHLTAAPQRVLDHVAALAPKQIVAADLRYPATATTEINRFNRPMTAPGRYPLASTI